MPFTFIVELPGAAAPVLPIVKVELPPGVTGFGEKVTVVFAGAPVALSVIGSVKPEMDVVLTV